MPTPTNEELMAQQKNRVEKAVIAADSLAAAGKLNPQQADKFIDYIIDQSMLKNNARIMRFKPETAEIDKIGLARRVALPAAEAADPRYRRGITTTKIVLQPREIIVPWEVSDIVGEINLEGAALLDHIVQMMAKQTNNDIEDLAINGDTLGAAILESDYIEGGDTTKYIKDSYMALFNGWLRSADTAHLYDAAGANVGPTVFSRMLTQLPTKWRRNMDQLRFFCSPDLEQLYREKTSTRATAVGDQALQSGVRLTPYGVQLVAAPLFPHTPKIVEHVAIPAAPGTVALRYRPVVAGSLTILPAALAGTPTTPYVEGVNYSVNYTTGVITNINLPATTYKVTYQAQPQILLTHMSNFIVAIGRDIRIEKDRDIYKRVNQYVITLKVSVVFEETDAIVKATNVGVSV
jgi:hypothetical protein